MDYRRDLLPPVLALALSAALHAGLGWWEPGTDDRAAPAETLPVVVEYRPGEGTGEPGAEAPDADPGETKPTEPPPDPAQSPEPLRLPTARAPEHLPKPPPEVSDTDIPADPIATPPQPPPFPEALPPSQPETPPPVRLVDLLPRADDLRPYTQHPPPPDPAGGEEREATLTLEDADVRYKGYLGQVQASIDRTWRWREAMLAARAGGQVLVRFSLASEGTVDDVLVVESSGSPLLDREATEAVRRALAPPFPRNWTIERLHLFAQFVYRLE